MLIIETLISTYWNFRLKLDGDGRGIDRYNGGLASMKSRKMRRDFAFVYSFTSSVPRSR